MVAALESRSAKWKIAVSSAGGSGGGSAVQLPPQSTAREALLLGLDVTLGIH